MFSNVYLPFFDESRLWDDVVRGGMGSYRIVRRSWMWYRILLSGTEWYVVVRCCSWRTMLYGAVRSGTGFVREDTV